MWGTIASAAISGIGALGSAKSGYDASRISREQLELQRDEWDWRMRMAEEALAREMDNARYMFDQNDWRLQQAEDYMNYSRGWAERDFNLRQDDALFAEYRISEADRLNAAERVRQLQRIAENRQLAQQERAEAMSELEYVKQIAQGERTYDERRFQEDRATQRREYDQRMREYQNLQRQLAEERAYEVGRSEEILSKSRQMGGMLERALSELGDMVPLKEYSEADVLALEDQYGRQLMEDAERMASRMGSLNEASLIGAGVDASTAGRAARKQLMEQNVAPLINQARAQARQEAMTRINSLQGLELSKFQADQQRRDQTLSEIVGALSPHIQALQATQMPTSAATTAWTGLGTGILDRNLRSANQFQAPIPVGTAMLPMQNLNIGMSGQMANPVSRYGSQLSAYNLADLNLWNPMSNMTLATGYLGGGSGANPLGWQQQSFNNWQAAGKGFSDFMNQLGPLFKGIG